jgi:uncharacterized membrane protein
VLDLKKLAADPKKIVPGMPEKSALWKLVRDGEMPAEGAKAGPLTKKEKSVIRAWIEAGAPSEANEQKDAETDKKDADVPSPPAAHRRLLDWLGNFHVVVVHLPIGLLLAAAVGELWFGWKQGRQPAPAVRFCTLLGAATAVVAAVLGWIHAAGGYGALSPSTLAWHRWMGTATAAGALVLAVCSAVDGRRGRRSLWFRLLLLLVALSVGVAGHLGGVLVYGPDYFDW